jgi:hypothetical protein
MLFDIEFHPSEKYAMPTVKQLRDRLTDLCKTCQCSQCLLGLFLREVIPSLVFSGRNEMRVSVFFRLYLNWCKERDIKPLTRQSFGKALVKPFGVLKHKSQLSFAFSGLSAVSGRVTALFVEHEAKLRRLMNS